MAPSHYLDIWWLIISKVQWHSSEDNFTRDISISYQLLKLLWNLLISLNSPRGQWVNDMYYTCTNFRSQLCPVMVMRTSGIPRMGNAWTPSTGGVIPRKNTGSDVVGKCVLFVLILSINSLALRRCGCNLDLIIFKLIWRVDIWSISCEIALRSQE